MVASIADEVFRNKIQFNAKILDRVEESIFQASQKSSSLILRSWQRQGLCDLELEISSSNLLHALFPICLGHERRKTRGKAII